MKKLNKNGELVMAAYNRGKADAEVELREKITQELKANKRNEQLQQTSTTLQRLAESFDQSMEAQARAVIEITKALAAINNIPLR